MTLRQLYAAISQLHERPQLIAYATTPEGRALVWGTATLLLAPSSTVYLVSPLLALILTAPRWRVEILSIGSIFAFYRLMSRYDVEPVALVGLFVNVTALLYLCYCVATSYRHLPQIVQRNGQIILHVLACTALIATFLVPAATGIDTEAPTIDAVRFLVPYLLWRCGYMLLSGRRGTAAQTRFVDHAFYSIPAYGGTAIPYGKGYDYLKRHQADDARAQATAALAGLKLLVLVWVWTACRFALALFVYGDDVRGLGDRLAPFVLDIPRLGEIIASPDSFALPIAWLSMILELVDITLTFASWGHMVIGTLRLFGFNVFRNTYKPLLATSLVDFWNRFYYYFKELLVEFFFFPTYVWVKKARPRLRIFVAVMSAAFLGNIYYHALLDLDQLVPAGLAGAWTQIGPRSFYCFLLGLGIFVSMIREQARRGAPAAETSALRTLRRISGVWLFYAVIHIWNVKPVALTFTQRTAFFFSLFGF